MRHLNILVVANNPMVTTLLQRLFNRQCPCDIDVAVDCTIAFNKSQQRHYDVIMTDVYIEEDRDGFGLINNIKHAASSLNSNTPVFFWGDKDPRYFVPFLKLDAEKFYKVPLSAKNIEEIINYLQKY